MCLKQRKTKDIIFRRCLNDLEKRKKNTAKKRKCFNHNKIKENKLDIIRIMDHKQVKIQ